MDRLAEERRRGITIDLNFAPLALPGGAIAGMVDVPGHEDFVRTMVAGASGIDLALLVVAADEGIMPQTLEHLAVLEHLGIAAGIPVVTKADLVEPDGSTLVLLEVAERLAGVERAVRGPGRHVGPDGRRDSTSSRRAWPRARQRSSPGTGSTSSACRWTGRSRWRAWARWSPAPRGPAGSGSATR